MADHDVAVDGYHQDGEQRDRQQPISHQREESTQQLTC